MVLEKTHTTRINVHIHKLSSDRRNIPLPTVWELCPRVRVGVLIHHFWGDFFGPFPWTYEPIIVDSEPESKYLATPKSRPHRNPIPEGNGGNMFFWPQFFWDRKKDPVGGMTMTLCGARKKKTTLPLPWVEKLTWFLTVRWIPHRCKAFLRGALPFCHLLTTSPPPASGGVWIRDL